MPHDWQKLKRQKLSFEKSHIHTIFLSIFQILRKPHIHYHQLYIKHTTYIRICATCVWNFKSCIFFILINKISFLTGPLIYYRNIIYTVCITNYILLIFSSLYIVQFDKFLYSPSKFYSWFYHFCWDTFLLVLVIILTSVSSKTTCFKAKSSKKWLGPRRWKWSTQIRKNH